MFSALFPCVISIWIFLYVVKSAALTKAIIHLDLESVEKILEDSESVHHLGELVRQKILRRLRIASATRPEDHVINFFKQLDIDNSNSLSRLEFKEALQIMRVSKVTCFCQADLFIVGTEISMPMKCQLFAFSYCITLLHY